MGQRPAPLRTRLTRRDQAILNYLGQCRFIAVDQLLREFFQDSKEGTHNHYRRLRRLMSAGYVTRLVGDCGVQLG